MLPAEFAFASSKIIVMVSSHNTIGIVQFNANRKLSRLLVYVLAGYCCGFRNRLRTACASGMRVITRLDLAARLAVLSAYGAEYSTFLASLHVLKTKLTNEIWLRIRQCKMSCNSGMS